MGRSERYGQAIETVSRVIRKAQIDRPGAAARGGADLEEF
jgi:hypothetical protein